MANPLACETCNEAIGFSQPRPIAFTGYVAGKEGLTTSIDLQGFHEGFP